MISFITVSKDDDKVGELTHNLSDALHGGDIDWELLRADGEQHDIFSGYNAMAADAAFDTMVFLHDDVRLLCHSTCLKKPLEIVKKPLTGIVGVAGTVLLPRDGTWWKANERDCRGMVAHPDSSDFGLHWNTWPHEAAQFGRVLICDGVFLMMSKQTFKRLNGFDAKTYQGFHYYDIDTCLRAHQLGLQNWVAPIPLLHGSRGRTNDNWEENRARFLNRFERALPIRL